MRLIAALLGAIPIVFASPTAIAESANLSGSLVMPSGKAVQGYPVLVTGTDAEGKALGFVATTDKNGVFNVQGLPAGEYTVAPANEPSASENVQIEAKEKSFLDYFTWAPRTFEKDIGTLKVTPGNKLQAPVE